MTLSNSLYLRICTFSLICAGADNLIGSRYAIFLPSLAKIDSKIYDFKACYLTAMTAITVLMILLNSGFYLTTRIYFTTQCVPPFGLQYYLPGTSG